MKNTESFLLIDTGGSKTLLRLVRADGAVFYETAGPGFGLPTDGEGPIPALSAMLADVPGQESIRAVAVNLGGRNQRGIERVIEAAFPGKKYTVVRESEGGAALAFGRARQAGVVLLCGTGSIAVATDFAGRYVISGGWGCLVGDEGSGYAIGAAALRRSLAELDGLLPLSPLAARITQEKAPFSPLADRTAYRDRRDRVRAQLGALDRRSVAAYARLTAEMAENGDPVAQAIMDDAGQALGRLALITAEKIGCGSVQNIALTGGLLHARHLWGRAFEATVREKMPHINFYYEADGLMEGLLSLALSL